MYRYELESSEFRMLDYTRTYSPVVLEIETFIIVWNTLDKIFRTIDIIQIKYRR